MYIHERSDWPRFRWDEKGVGSVLAKVRHQQGLFVGKMEGLRIPLRSEATLSTLTEDVMRTSEIEGEILDRKQVRSSIARRLGIDIGARSRVDRRTEGVVEMSLDAIQNHPQGLTKERLFKWHRSLFPTGRSGPYAITVGAWRNDKAGPMRVVSGSMGGKGSTTKPPRPDALRLKCRPF